MPIYKHCGSEYTRGLWPNSEQGLVYETRWLFSIDWSHLWLPYNNCQNEIKVLREPHMKYNVTQLEGKNEPVNFSHSVLGNYFIELEPGNY